MKNLFAAVVLLFLCIQSVNAQSESKALSNAVSSYREALGYGAAIYYGPENPDPQFPVNEGSQFFGDGRVVAGEVHYDKLLYTNVPIWYDLVNGQVATLHPSGGRVALNPDKVAYFKIGDNVFVRADSVFKNSPGGFLERLHEGKLTLLARHSSRMNEIIRERQYMTNFTRPRTDYFLLKDGEYVPVRNTSNLLGLLDSDELREYERSSRVRGESPVATMTRILKYYDQ